jgi:hypothetical protein
MKKAMDAFVPYRTSVRLRRFRKDHERQPKWESARTHRPHYARREMRDMTVEEISDMLEAVNWH